MVFDMSAHKRTYKNQRPSAEHGSGPFQGTSSNPQLCWWSLILRHLPGTIQTLIPFRISNFKFVNRKPPSYNRRGSKQELRGRPTISQTFGGLAGCRRRKRVDRAGRQNIRKKQVGERNCVYTDDGCSILLINSFAILELSMRMMLS